MEVAGGPAKNRERSAMVREKKDQRCARERREEKVRGDEKRRLGRFTW